MWAKDRWEHTPTPHLATCLELDLWVPKLVHLIICYVT